MNTFQEWNPILASHERCAGCGTGAAVCPLEALEMFCDKDGLGLCHSPRLHRNGFLFFTLWRGCSDLGALIRRLTVLSLREGIVLHGHIRRLSYRARGKFVAMIRGGRK